MYDTDTRGRSVRSALPRISMKRAALSMMLAPWTMHGHAADDDLTGGRIGIHGSISAGAAYRTESQDTTLTPNVNSSQVDIVGHAITPTAGRNQDDGNLNFDKGHAVSQVVNGYLSVDYTSGAYGGLASVKAWYDYALAKRSVPWGNIPSGYAPDAPLSDAGAQPRSKFSGVVLDNLYVAGHDEAGGMPFDWRLGWQKLDWGNRYIVVGGLRDLNPIDIPALTRPGMLQRDQETRIPVPQVFARLGLAESTSVEGFYQFHFERNALNQCGTFYSGADWVADGCNAIVFGNQTDRAAIATNNFVHRTANVLPSNAGQFGVALTQSVDAWATRFGLYLAQFHSRTGYSGLARSRRLTGAPYVPGNPDGLNPTYYTEWPEDIRMLGLTFETRFEGGTAFGELTYRPNQPLQINAADLLNAVVSDTAPTLLRDRANALPPGGLLTGFERHKAAQLQLGAVGQVAGVLGATAMNWGAEVVYKTIPDLPDPSVVRFGRSDVFGQGPVNGVCPPPAVPSQCTSDGYVSRNAWGVRTTLGLRYANVADGVDLVPSLLFGQDVSGWSGDGAVSQGRKLAIVSLRANFRSGFVGDIAWAPTWGGPYINQRDRSAVIAYVGLRF
jgi:hypothetical protein